MDITICGHRKAVKILEAFPNQLDVVFISSPDTEYAIESSEKIPVLAKETCRLLFHDISSPRGSMVPPSQSDIEKALAFAKGRNKLIVTCQAGVSRSSAIAYLIQAAEVGMNDALNILDPEIHQPNSLIVFLGSKILKNPDLVELINNWKNAANEYQSEQEWIL